MKLLNQQIQFYAGEPLDIDISSHFKLKKVTSKNIVSANNKTAKHLYYLKKGMVRSFYYHHHKEITSWVYTENMFFTSWCSFIFQKPSFETIEALENCELYQINISSLKTLEEQSTVLNNFSKNLYAQTLGFLDEYSKAMLFMTAKEKYTMIQQYLPGIENRLQLSYLASLLGISQETLSRLRKSVFDIGQKSL